LYQERADVVNGKHDVAIGRAKFTNGLSPHYILYELLQYIGIIRNGPNIPPHATDDAHCDH